MLLTTLNDQHTKKLSSKAHVITVVAVVTVHLQTFHRVSSGNDVRTVGSRHAISYTIIYTRLQFLHCTLCVQCTDGRTEMDPFPGAESLCPRAQTDRKLLSLRRARRHYYIQVRTVLYTATTVRRRVAYCARDRKRRPRPVLSSTYNLIRTRATHTHPSVHFARVYPPNADPTTSAIHPADFRFQAVPSPLDSSLYRSVNVILLLLLLFVTNTFVAAAAAAVLSGCKRVSFAGIIMIL